MPTSAYPVDQNLARHVVPVKDGSNYDSRPRRPGVCRYAGMATAAPSLRAAVEACRTADARITTALDAVIE